MSWIFGLSTRLVLAKGQEFLAVSDSVPLAMPSINWDQLQKLDRQVATYLLHAYQCITAMMLRHVRHAEVPVHCDSSSDIKLLAFAFEMGWLRNPPLLADYQAMGLKKISYLVPHPISNQRLLFWGCGQTEVGYRPENEPNLPRADTHGRKHSMVWVALGWGEVETTGGVLPPGVTGGSAQGKSPIPNDILWEWCLQRGIKMSDAPTELYDLAVAAYAQRRAKAVHTLRQDASTYQMLKTTQEIRPITDWICRLGTRNGSSP